MFIYSETGSVLVEQYGSSEKRVDFFQSGAESGQSNFHGDIAFAVSEKSIRILPRSRSKGRNNTAGRKRTSEYNIEDIILT